MRTFSSLGWSAIVLAAGLLFVPISGCLFLCHTPERMVAFRASGLPSMNRASVIPFSYREYNGDLTYDEDHSSYILSVASNHTVSHEALTAFAVAMFEWHHWPGPPAFNPVNETTGCADSW